MAKGPVRHEKPVVRPEALSAPWVRNFDDAAAGSAAIGEVDRLAYEMENFWGVGRLRLLVSLDLRERFDRQVLLYRNAIRQGAVSDVTAQATRMAAGWRKLDRQAREDGHRGVAEVAEVWETATPDGEVVAIVKNDADAAHVLRSGRALQVYTLAEIARLLGAVGNSIGVIKTVFPGAKVLPHIPSPDVVGSFDDEIPF